MDLSVQELEAAINYWRDRRPARGSEVALTPEVNILATIYALMIYRRHTSIDLDTLDPGARQLVLAARVQPDQTEPPCLNSKKRFAPVAT